MMTTTGSCAEVLPTGGSPSALAPPPRARASSLRAGDLEVRSAAVVVGRQIDGTAPLDLDDPIGVSAPFKRVLHQVAQVAPTDATVLVTGEPGPARS